MANANDLPAPGSLGAWILASRPPTLSAAVIPVFVGAACAHVAGGLRWDATIVALLGALWIQVGTNFANDVFDFEQGADTEERLGPTRAVQAGLLSPAQMRRGMWLAFGLAFLCGVYLTWLAGWPLMVLGIAAILSGIAYTGGPFPLGYNGLGDVFVMIFFGFVAVCGTVYANMSVVTELSWWAAIPVGAIATAILVVNNVRDREQDAQAGKRTLAVRWGRRAVLVEYYILIAATYAVPVILFAQGANAWILLPLLSLPPALILSVRLTKLEGPPLNAVLVGTAKLLIIYGVLFSIGILLSLGPVPAGA